ncbi:PREDICTED: uncharacterized protein LOC103327296 isoform X3 [Prunus mume]|uniref:Uncharacterized protein LOC103327296 isoform X3 n=1 Tax=Prunus mume TaxID=102107 RepID=A0ABM1LPD4_PRUMU|nr:PREDICTED: uncharacterized protein LOC103327296 isoform X3 [Prunus mume]
MAGLEGNEHQQQLQLFSVGSAVEVRSDEEGFKGAWFRATIVTSPTNLASKKRKRALVEYKSLVTEDGSQQLKEYVDSALLRPVPPPLGDQNFEEGDVVDADYKDGWWTGVVKKVLDNSKYTVVFEFPPDLIEFEGERLRLHQDWDAGKWVRPNKKEVLAASDSPQNKDHVLHAQNDSNHVEVATLLENLGAVEDNPESKNSGKSLLEQPSYPRSIKSKKMLARNVTATDSGPSKKLKDDKAAEATLSITARQLRKMPDNKEMLHELATVSRGVRGTRRSRKPVVSHQHLKTESLLEENNVTKEERDGEVDSQWVHPVTSKGRRTKSPFGSRLTQAGYICALPSQKREKEKGKEEYASVNSAGKIVQKEGISKEAEVPHTIRSKAKEKDGSLAEIPCQLPNDPAQEKSMVMSAELGSDSIFANLLRSLVLFPDMEFKQQPAGGSTHKRKRGRPRKFVDVGPQASEGVKGQNGLGQVADGNVAENQTLEEVALHVLRGMDSTDSQDASRRKTAEFPGTRCMTNEPARTCVGADDDDRPLSMWFGGMQHPASVGESRSSPDGNVREPVEVARRESLAVDAVSGSGQDEKGGLPFVKSSPVWMAIETLEVFRMIPQSPHFRPLSQCKEEYREGSAIGNMITFSRLAEKISRLHFDEPKDDFISILESLLDLEKYGFNVTVLRERVNHLLSVKDRQGQFQVESKDAESKIREHSHEKTKLVEEADCIEKKIIELKEKHASLKLEVGAKDLEIARLQKLVDAMSETIQSARSDFEKLASATLK